MVHRMDVNVRLLIIPMDILDSEERVSQITRDTTFFYYSYFSFT